MNRIGLFAYILLQRLADNGNNNIDLHQAEEGKKENY